MALKINLYQIFAICFSQSVPSTRGRGNNGAEIDHYRIFCNLSPLPRERVRERAKPQDAPYRFSDDEPSCK